MTWGPARAGGELPPGDSGEMAVGWRPQFFTMGPPQGSRGGLRTRQRASPRAGDRGQGPRGDRAGSHSAFLWPCVPGLAASLLLYPGAESYVREPSPPSQGKWAPPWEAKIIEDLGAYF